MLGMDAPQFAEAIAAEVRAEMARQKKQQSDLAKALGVTPATVSRRLNDAAKSGGFSSIELFRIATWLGVPPTQFYPAVAEVSA